MADGFRLFPPHVAQDSQFSLGVIGQDGIGARRCPAKPLRREHDAAKTMPAASPGDNASRQLPPNGSSCRAIRFRTTGLSIVTGVQHELDIRRLGLAERPAQRDRHPPFVIGDTSGALRQRAGRSVAP